MCVFCHYSQSTFRMALTGVCLVCLMNPSLLRVWPTGQQRWIMGKLVRSAKRWAPAQTHWIRACILTRLPGDSTAYQSLGRLFA